LTVGGWLSLETIVRLERTSPLYVYCFKARQNYLALAHFW
jgi:hypothetical protein